MPININFGENHYLDKVTLQPEQFYNLLSETNDHPKTSQINENTFVNLYSHLASHYDSVIAIHLSDQLSGTFFSSQKAARKISDEFGKPITVLNSRNLSGSLGLIMLRTAQAIESGFSHDEIVSLAEKWIQNTRIFVSVKTLKYMVRGGRVSAAKGLIARILNINPIVSLDETGKAILFDKTFSQKANMEKVMSHIRKINDSKKIWNYIVLHANNIKISRLVFGKNGKTDQQETGFSRQYLSRHWCKCRCRSCISCLALRLIKITDDILSNLLSGITGDNWFDVQFSG